MKRAGYYAVVLLLMSGLLSGWVQAQPAKPVNAIRLMSLDQKPVRLAAFPERLLVLVFLSPECPVCQGYVSTLNDIQKMQGADVTVVGILPGKSYSIVEYQQFIKEYGVTFTLLQDRSNALRKALKASITPEVYLLDAQRNVLYAGAIDDQVVALGRRKSTPTQRYLTNAIVAWQHSQPIDPPRTKAIGCYINDF